jgi:hypothetical protein
LAAGNAPYEVLPPDGIYFGKTYSNFAQDWFNWFLTTDPDKRTLGQVVFLRSVKMPKEADKSKYSNGVADLPTSPYSSDDLFPRRYNNEPNVKIGADRLQIYLDQYVFCPVLVATWIATKPYHDFGFMQEYCGLTLDHGDNPPNENQLKINGENVQLPEGKKMKDFRIATSVFTAVVPDTDYGRSLGAFLEEEALPGQYAAMVEGFFLLIRFNKKATYRVYSAASAGREVKGSYFAQYVYEIEALERVEKGSRGSPGFKLARNDAEICRILTEKLSRGEISPEAAKKIGHDCGLDVVKNFKDFNAEVKRNKQNKSTS